MRINSGIVGRGTLVAMSVEEHHSVCESESAPRPENATTKKDLRRSSLEYRAGIGIFLKRGLRHAVGLSSTLSLFHSRSCGDGGETKELGLAFITHLCLCTDGLAYGMRTSTFHPRERRTCVGLRLA